MSEVLRKLVMYAVVPLLVIALCCVVFAVLTFEYPLRNVGKVHAVGVSVFEDENCTTSLTWIDWDLVYPGSHSERSLYLKNNGTLSILLVMTVGNWTPVNASEYLFLSWDLENVTMVESEVLMATLTLDVALNVTIAGFKEFTFDIMFTGVEFDEE